MSRECPTAGSGGGRGRGGPVTCYKVSLRLSVNVIPGNQVYIFAPSLFRFSVVL